MSANDGIVVDGIIQDIQNKDHLDVGEAFEKFAFQQILKDCALSAAQIEDGWIDGEGDGGIDGFYVLVNGYLYNGADGFQWPREDPRITIWVITCKHREGFIEAPLTSLHMTLTEFWDCTRDNQSLVGVYSEALLECRDILIRAYTALAHLDPLIDIHIVYASRGDSSCVSDSVRGRMKQLEQLGKQYFSKNQIECKFVGARDLLTLYRKVREDNLVLPFESSLTHDDNNYVVIATLKEYYNFVKDDGGALRRYLFDSNVRDFLGYNNVNGDIDYSLKNPSQANFWWLNNGITILANNAHVVGRSLHLKGVQIVNGLQTTETIYRHFSSNNTESIDKNILIKVITSQDEEIRVNIIQATNNQSNVMSYSLHATDDVQRDIEEMLRKDHIYYERRDHYYRNEGMPSWRFITPLEIAKSYVSVVLRNPSRAAGLKNKFMRNKASYEDVFCSDFPVDKWSLLATSWILSKRVYSKKFLNRHGGIDRLHQWLPLVVLCAVARACGTLDYDLKKLKKISLLDISETTVEEIWELIDPFIGSFKTQSRNKLANPRVAYDKVLYQIATHFSWSGVEGCNVRKLKTIGTVESRHYRQDRHKYVLTTDILDEVKRNLPPQPWEPGMHRKLSAKLGLPSSCVYEAVDLLTERGLVFRQKDGVVYDARGKAILVDAERCTLTLDEINGISPAY